MEIPDPIERAEASAERWAEENVRGETMTCGCGKTCSLSEAETVSANPYAIPVCPDCLKNGTFNV